MNTPTKPLLVVPELSWKWSGTPGEDLHDALRWACKRFRPRRYLEIGVDGGGSLKTVLGSCDPERIVLCDMWGTNHAGHGFQNWKHIYPIVEISNAKVDMITGDSRETVPKIMEFFDLILVDGDHSYEACLQDLKSTWPLMANGGLLILDDIGHHVYPGVEKAFREFVEGKQDELRLIEEEGLPWRNCAIFQRMP